MHSISSEEDFALVFAQEYSTIFLFVDWSVYAVQGRQIFEELESTWGHDLNASFWIADVSDLNAPAAFLGVEG